MNWINALVEETQEHSLPLLPCENTGTSQLAMNQEMAFAIPGPPSLQNCKK